MKKTFWKNRICSNFLVWLVLFWVIFVYDNNQHSFDMVMMKMLRMMMRCQMKDGKNLHLVHQINRIHALSRQTLVVPHHHQFYSTYYYYYCYCYYCCYCCCSLFLLTILSTMMVRKDYVWLLHVVSQ